MMPIYMTQSEHLVAGERKTGHYMKFHPSALKSQEDMKKLADLMKTYFATGGKHVQFNVVNADTLIEAQKEPEHHRDLVVRVAGYSAYFVELSKNTQEEIIERTEYQKST